MAVGDVVNGISAGANLTFQPAAGVECMITCLFETQGYLSNFRLTNGTTDAVNNAIANVAPNPFNAKMFINNTNYLLILANASNNAGFTGIQIK